MKDARINGGGEEVVGGRDRMDVARHMKVELLHRHNLRVPAARRAALDAKRRPHAGLADASEHRMLEVGANRLREPDRRRALALAEWGWVYPADDDVVAIRFVFQTVVQCEAELSLKWAIRVHFCLLQAELAPEELTHGRELDRLCNLNVLWRWGQDTKHVAAAGFEERGEHADALGGGPYTKGGHRCLAHHAPR